MSTACASWTWSLATASARSIQAHDSLREVTVAIRNDAGHQAVGLASAEALDDEAGGRVADIYQLCCPLRLG